MVVETCQVSARTQRPCVDSLGIVATATGTLDPIFEDRLLDIGKCAVNVDAAHVGHPYVEKHEIGFRPSRHA